MNTYLTVLAVAVGCCTVAGILLYLSEQAHRDVRVARHRAGAVARVPANHNPLAAWTRQSLAPTANAQVALPAGPLEETCALRAPGDDYEIDEYEAADEHWLDELTGDCICGAAWPCPAGMTEVTR